MTHRMTVAVRAIAVASLAKGSRADGRVRIGGIRTI